MDDKLELEYRGKRYTVERGKAAGAAATGGGSPVGTGQWYVSLNLAAITSLPVEAGEDEAGLRARVVAWLAAHPEMQGGDEIYLGGG
jgi:hypothetical protein